MFVRPSSPGGGGATGAQRKTTVPTEGNGRAGRGAARELGGRRGPGTGASGSRDSTPLLVTLLLPASPSSHYFWLQWEPDVPAIEGPSKQNQKPSFKALVPKTKRAWAQVWRGSLFSAQFQSNRPVGFIKISKLWATSVTSI